MILFVCHNICNKVNSLYHKLNLLIFIADTINKKKWINEAMIWNLTVDLFVTHFISLSQSFSFALSFIHSLSFSFYPFLALCWKLRPNHFFSRVSTLCFLLFKWYTSKWFRLRVIKFKISLAQNIVTVLRSLYKCCGFFFHHRWFHKTRI